MDSVYACVFLSSIKNWLGFGNHTELKEADKMKKFLIVGLGNVGQEYANTRHNIGFKILDYIANSEEVSFETLKLADVTTIKIKGRLPPGTVPEATSLKLPSTTTIPRVLTVSP